MYFSLFVLFMMCARLSQNRDEQFVRGNRICCGPMSTSSARADRDVGDAFPQSEQILAPCATT